MGKTTIRQPQLQSNPRGHFHDNGLQLSCRSVCKTVSSSSTMVLLGCELRGKSNRYYGRVRACTEFAAPALYWLGCARSTHPPENGESAPLGVTSTFRGFIEGTFSMSKDSRGIGLVQAVWILAGFLVVVAAGFHLLHCIRGSSIRFGTPYQTVLLTNGSVYFGHLQDYGSSHPALTDVFYVVKPIPKPNR